MVIDVSPVLLDPRDGLLFAMSLSEFIAKPGGDEGAQQYHGHQRPQAVLQPAAAGFGGGGRWILVGHGPTIKKM